MILLVSLLVGATGLILIPITVLLFEVVLAVTLRRRAPPLPATARPGIVIVIPAHDEGTIIGDTLRAIRPQIRSTDRLIVVADNCRDDTAAIAAAEGAAVLRREDPVHRGKGYALDFAIRHLGCDARKTVLFIDADCRMDARSIDSIAGLCVQTQRPVQALYLMQAPADAGPLIRIAEFAWIVKNRVRPLGMLRLGLPCHLMGTGMAFPWACIEAAQLATGHIAEDVKIGVELARVGKPPLFCPEACVTSAFPKSQEGMQSQRTRWEHGQLDFALTEVPRLLVHALAERNMALLSLVIDLCVPPLALLLLLGASLWVMSAAFYVAVHASLPLIMTTTAMSLLTLSVLLSWSRYGRGIVSLGDLLWAGRYALAKIPLYARFLLAKQSVWVRSKRD